MLHRTGISKIALVRGGADGGGGGEKSWGHVATLASATTILPMRITGTHHVAICTPNFASLCDFYVNTLGLKKIGHFDGRNIIFVSAGNTTIEIVERNEPLQIARIGWAHFAFEVQDIDAVHEELKKKGIVFHIEPKLFPETNPAVKLAFFKDPDGNELELVQPLKTRYPNQI